MGGSNSAFRSGTSCEWDAALTISAPRIYFDGATFDSEVSANQTGTTADAYSTGNCTFNGTVELINTGNRKLQPGGSNGNTYNEDITFRCDMAGGSIRLGDAGTPWHIGGW